MCCYRGIRGKQNSVMLTGVTYIYIYAPINISIHTYRHTHRRILSYAVTAVAPGYKNVIQVRFENIFFLTMGICNKPRN